MALYLQLIPAGGGNSSQITQNRYRGHGLRQFQAFKVSNRRWFGGMDDRIRGLDGEKR
jgi:hypothetical protein